MGQTPSISASPTSLRIDSGATLFGRGVRFTCQQVMYEPAYVAAALRGLLAPA
ncbi:MAG: hypothetical protein Q8K79_19525 [Solirubrobacteraceae bacterium]|nr:hypothetical protein [Solirubrobacteraceae bacterium]